MRPMEFSGVSLEFWNAKLKDIAMAEKFGVIHPPGATILYPAILLRTETRQFYIMELIGSTPSYTPLVEKRHKEPVIDRYFAQFDFEPSNAIMKLSGVDTGFANIGFQNEGVEEKLSARFPYLADRFKTWFVSGLESRGLIEIAPGAKFVFFEDCILVNDFSDAVRIKHLNMVIVVAKQTTRYDYNRYLTEHFAGPEMHGVAMVPPQREARGRQIAVQFANVFLTPNLRETTIGEFFRTHAEFIRRAFCSPRFVYEPYLEW
jgi:hypothetical protein